MILSDLWVPPSGPNWENCAIFIPENKTLILGDILETYEKQFPRMAEAARLEWEQWFAPETLFHRMTEYLKEIVATRRAPERVLCRKMTTRYLRLRARAAKRSLIDLVRLRPNSHRPASSRPRSR